MFKHKTEMTHAERCMDQILDEIETCDPKERIKRICEVRQLAEVNEMIKKNVEKKCKIDVNNIIKTAGMLLGVVLLGNYERTKIVPQKAANLFMKQI